jgi:hypothetical protein
MKEICREGRRYVAYVDGRKIWSTPVNVQSSANVSALLGQGWSWVQPEAVAA